MSRQPKRYQFQTQAQWQAGIVIGGLIGQSGLMPVAPLAAAPQCVWAGDAYAPAALATGEVYWRDAAGALHWLSDADPPEVCGDALGNGALGMAQRIVATDGLLWASSADATQVAAFELRRLQQIAAIAPGGTVRDIATADRHAVAALTIARDVAQFVQIDDHRRLRPLQLPALDGTPFQLARTTRRWVVADADQRRLLWVDPEPGTSGQWAALPLDALGPGLGIVAIAAFPPTGLLLACSDSAAAPGRLFVLGSEGDVLTDAPLPAAIGAVHGIAGAGATVWIASSTGLWRWDAADGSGLTVEASFITPTLRSPLGQDSGWLRAEIAANLPPGATLACQIASTAKPSDVEDVQKVLSDPTLTTAAKAMWLESHLSWQSPRQIGAGQDQPVAASAPAVTPPSWVLPLHDVADEFLWLKLQITGGPGTQVSSLVVLYPELSLMQRLPAIYRAAPSTHLRGLVALLNVATQDLDHRIATLGSLIDPATTPDEWLDFLASWLGLPWEAGLPATMRRALLQAAPDLLATRGTAAGLRRLLQALLPNRPVRLSDAADLNPALLPQPGEGGTAGPLVLLGRPQDLTRLNVAVLGRTCLRDCHAADDPMLPLAGWLVIEVSATDAERTALGGALARLLAAYVPAGITPVLRWHSWPMSGTGRRLDEDLSLSAERPGVLGQDIRLGGIALGGVGPSLRAGIDLSDNDRLL